MRAVDNEAGIPCDTIFLGDRRNRKIGLRYGRFGKQKGIR
jgi:hypothetical protein